MTSDFDIWDYFNEYDGSKEGNTLEMLRTMRVFLMNTPHEVHGVDETLVRTLVASARNDHDEEVRRECRRIVQVLEELKRT